MKVSKVKNESADWKTSESGLLFGSGVRPLRCLCNLYMKFSVC